MYRKILLCLDNSDCSNAGIELSTAIARSSGARVTGCHVYAARLHNSRFQQMESGLPPRYQKEEELQRQREVHDSLITKGLQIISDSYLAFFQTKASEAGVQACGVSREGKNYHELVSEINEGGYDLAVIGAKGLGATPMSRLGSVCERVVRRISTDVLVSRVFNEEPRKKIIAAIDGSPASFGGLKSALALSKVFGCSVEAVSAFDPDYHYRAFRSIAGVLSESAGKVFRFKEQEKLHEEIIDKGLAKIYQGHLDTAESMAAGEGAAIEKKLLSGKPFEEILKYASTVRPFMLVMGKTGVHSNPGLDIGSNTEFCLREAGCHLLITSREETPAQGKGRKSPVRWDAGAEAVLSKVPPFARGVVKNMVEEAAEKEGRNEIDAEFMLKVRNGMKMGKE